MTVKQSVKLTDEINDNIDKAKQMITNHQSPQAYLIKINHLNKQAKLPNFRELRSTLYSVDHRFSSHYYQEALAELHDLFNELNYGL